MSDIHFTAETNSKMKDHNRSVMQPSIAHATQACAMYVCVRVYVNVMFYSSEIVLSQSGTSLLTVYREKDWILLLVLRLL